MKKSAYIVGAASFLGGFYLGGKMLVDMINDYQMRADKNSANMMLFNEWVDFLYSGGHIEQYFQENQYKKIMIYGNGFAGARLQQALEKTDIEVVAVMDKAAHPDADGTVIGTDADIPDVDCIVVTPVFSHAEICEVLSKRTGIPIVSVREILCREVP